jgi:8-oxo-dGTP pyrophosphatase MutT (NUDIX family)
MFEIPAHRLPPGFAEQVDRPPAPPAPARPAATAVLLRQGPDGPETLMLRRHRSSGFVPGAYVFPGGRVDAADGDPALAALAAGLPAGGEPPPGYWLAAAREVFEETGVLPATQAGGEPVVDARRWSALEEWRERLMRGTATLREVLDALALRLDFTDVVYFDHWITPIAEPRRYDTRFFLARLPDGAEAHPDPREMTDARWLTPAGALEAFDGGALPMVFPTVKTLDAMTGYDSVAALLDAFRGRPIVPRLPRLIRTGSGVAIVLD